MALVRPDYKVAECYWGGTAGSTLGAQGVSVPAGHSARALTDPGASASGDADEDEEVALWGLLERDPLFELRLLSPGQDTAEELPPHAIPMGQQLEQAARRLPLDASIVAVAEEAGVGEVLGDAVETVVSDPTVSDVMRMADGMGGELRGALARAVTAEALRAADDAACDVVALDGAHRDALVDAIAAALGGSDRGLGGMVLRSGLRLALSLGATKPVERRRAAITRMAAPAGGDVLLYLSRGQALRDFIIKTISALDGPVAIVAHSLGGVASLEALAGQQLAAVELLVTVGSQAPLLYELNALPTLPFGATLPSSVPRWVNVYDQRDLLAYVGEGVFARRVEDRRIDSKSPFPRSHSAYFANRRFYTLLGEVLP
ncbi:hypothetical protein C4B68_39560 [Streptomyces dengpaensis]|uniref:Alpha/beta hydrolase n=1 Tax=Streptomyces dengpaensis TaxID=2049881 RepID=A0ABN5ICH3_9ACTN|nr:hypothetical protein C4B68_39560 [Streptomyces dengpaensis]